LLSLRLRAFPFSDDPIRGLHDDPISSVPFFAIFALKSFEFLVPKPDLLPAPVPQVRVCPLDANWDPQFTRARNSIFFAIFAVKSFLPAVRDDVGARNAKLSAMPYSELVAIA
jgi:hypothetical protein